MNIITSYALWVLAFALLLGGRPGRATKVLAAFLVTVGLNFSFGALVFLGFDTLQLSFFPLALDPVLLLWFTTLYPYRRSTPVERGALVATATLAVISVIILASNSVDPIGGNDAWRNPANLVPVATLVVGYSAAWLMAVRAGAKAPTKRLAEKSRWLIIAVGIATVPRLGLLTIDMDFKWGIGRVDTWAEAALGASKAVGGSLLLSGIALLAAVPLVRDAPAPVRSAVKVTLWVTLGLALLRLLGQTLQNAQGIGWEASAPFTLRWIVFAVVLVYGILAGEMVEFREAAERVFPTLAGLFAMLVAAFFVLVNTPSTHFMTRWGLAASLGFGVAVPAGWSVRRVVHFYEGRRGANPAAVRRFELYRNALEAAYASGPPDAEARRDLERRRHRFGVTLDEARALEHGIRRGGADRFMPGDEPLAGVTIQRLIGEGGQGRVYEVWRHDQGKKGILKVLRPPEGYAAGNALMELEAMQRIRHPHIAPLLAVDTRGDDIIMLTEFIDATPLDRVLEDGPMSHRDVGVLARDVLSALASCHAEGLIHLDIKPSNILWNGRAFVTDFGLAAATEAIDADRTLSAGSRRPAGTLAAMAPEQIRGRPGPATDLYQVGLLVYQALTGRQALDVRGLHYVDALAEVSDPIIEMDRVPPMWLSFVRSALQVDPADRPRCAEDLADLAP